MTLKNILTIVGCVVITNQAIAGSLPDPRNFPIGQPTLQCVEQAAHDHKVPFALLLGVNSIERGKTGQNVGNSNGSLDTGAFQINSIHFARAKKLNASHGDLASRGCYNAQFAAMLLSEALSQKSKQHLDIYTRGAGYHSWTPKYNAIYRKKLVKYTNEWQVWLNNNAPTQQYNVNSPQEPTQQYRNQGVQHVNYQREPNPFLSGFIGQTSTSHQ